MVTFHHPSWPVLLSLAATQVLAACGDSGTGSMTPPVVLIRTSDVAADGTCPSGATRVEVGLDNGDGGGTAGDSVLQAGEIDEIQMICATADGTLSTSRTLDPGGACPLGGVEVSTGLDDGDGGEVAGDGMLGPGEVDETQVLCASTGSDTVTDTVVLPAGDDDCSNGGTRVDYGFDNGDGGGNADNGTLETGEIDDSILACNDAPGEPPRLVSRASDLGSAPTPRAGPRAVRGAEFRSSVTTAAACSRRPARPAAPTG